MHVLLIEDDEAILKGLSFTLKLYYSLSTASSIKDVQDIDMDTIDFIILDVTLPDGNGFELFEIYLKQFNIPTLFLTARDDENDIVKGLSIGGEDYMTKPFSTKELLIRIQKILMRTTKNNIITIQDITYDINKMEVYKHGKLIALSSLERKILNTLFLNLNKVVRRDTLLDKIWQWTGNDVDDHTVTVYIKRIREKLNSDIIITVKGAGYRIDEK